MRKFLLAFFALTLLFSAVLVSAEENSEDLPLHLHEFEVENTGEFSASTFGGGYFDYYGDYIKKHAKKHKKTIVYGETYGQYTDEALSGVNLTVTCYHNEIPYTKYTTSNEWGEYLVQFKRWKGEKCSQGDPITIYAEHEGLYGFYEGYIDGYHVYKKVLKTWIDVPLVPEFGFVVGMLTMISAVGIFFVVRRE